MKSIFEGLNMNTPDDIKKIKLNFCSCINPHFTYVDKSMLASLGYEFQVFQFENIHHFKEALNQMTEQEKSAINLFYTHEHDTEGDTDIVDEVGQILNENQINYPYTVRASVVGINVDYRNSIPWGYIKSRKQSLRTKYDMAIYYRQIVEPEYWHSNRVNNRKGLTFLEGLFKCFNSQLKEFKKYEFIDLINK